MRFKDFGETEQLVSLSSGPVSVSTTLPSESEAIKKLERSNADYLFPWRLPNGFESSSSKTFTIRYNSEIAGQIILFNFQLHDGLRSCSISYWVSEHLANRHIATTSVELVVTYAFSSCSVDEVDATIQPENTPSIKVIENLKYHHRSIHGEGMKIGNRWQNFTVYTVTKDLKDES